MTKRARLNDIVKYCEMRFDRGDVSIWKHSDFVDLSREIQRDTDVSISLNTLKRIFGRITVDEDYIPQQATLDALKKYGRYVEPENQQLVVQPAVQPQPDPLPKSEPELLPKEQLLLPKKEINFSRFKIELTILAAVLVIIGYISWRFLKPQPISGKISLLHIEGHLPATASFELRLPQIDDSLFINFGDKSPLIYIKPGEKRVAHIYYIPGVFTVSVLTRRQAMSTTGAYIPSASWIGLVFHNQQEIPDHFYAFPATKTGNDSLFQVTNSQLSTMGLDTTGVVLTRFCNYTPVAHSADNFIFEATFKNTIPEKSNYCRGTQFQVSGSNNIIRFKLVSPGCSLRVLNIVGEQTFNGAMADLSQYVYDLNKWNTVKLVNYNKQVSLYVNGKQIFNGAYQHPLGDVRGLFLEFEGTGFVKSCELKSDDGKILYHF